MKNKSYRVIIHADLNRDKDVSLLLFRLRRWPDVDMVHHFVGENALLILVSTFSVEACDELILRLEKLDDIVAVRPHFLFSRVQVFSFFQVDGGGSDSGILPRNPIFFSPVVKFLNKS